MTSMHMGNRVAVIGAGMTRFVRRSQETPSELTAAAVQMALDDAGLTMDDIDSVCLGTAPDAFDGIHMNGENLIAGCGATRKPYLRHYVGGGTGIMSPIHGWMHVASGKFKNCLVVTEEKMSPCSPHPAGAFLSIFDHTTEQPLELTLIHIFSIEMCRFMAKYGYTEEEIAQVSVLCKKNAMNHPAAQIAQEITVKDVMDSPVLSWPVKRLDISPTSDAACAIVLSNEHIARTHCKAPVFIEGVGFRLDTAYWNTRDLAFPNYVAMAAQDAFRMAGITNPKDEIDIWEPYDPFDYKALHHMNALLQDKTGRLTKELLNSGQFERTGSHPMCPSGGALGVGNPIAATGLMKIAELYFQLSGQAGARQVSKNAHRGIAQAWGDLMQVGTVVVMNSEGAMPNQNTRWTNMKTEDMAGTPLKDASDVRHVEDRPDFRYSWDNGMALTTYLDGFKAGKIRASHCAHCGRMMIPARAFCEVCNLREVTDYYDMPDTGTVKTYTLSNIHWDSSFLPDGKMNIFAVIEIDGAGEDMGLIHKMGEVDPKDVKIGMKVKAVWKPEAERTGTVLDCMYFRPMKDGEDKDLKPVRVKATELDVESGKAFPGKIPLFYRYTAGLAGEKFYAELSKGKLCGTRCEETGDVYIPPATFAEDSMAKMDPEKDAVEVDAAGGMVIGYTTVYEDRSGHALDAPHVIVQVGYPGTVGSVIGTLDVADPEEVEIGMLVELVATKKTGPDNVKFKPVK